MGRSAGAFDGLADEKFKPVKKLRGREKKKRRKKKNLNDA